MDDGIGQIRQSRDGDNQQPRQAIAQIASGQICKEADTEKIACKVAKISMQRDGRDCSPKFAPTNYPFATIHAQLFQDRNAILGREYDDEQESENQCWSLFYVIAIFE